MDINFVKIVWEKGGICKIYISCDPLNPLETGDFIFYQSQELSTFWGLFIFLLNQSFIYHGSQFSLFTILQEHMSL